MEEQQTAANTLALFPEVRREKHKGKKLSRWLTSPPEACLFHAPYP